MDQVRVQTEQLRIEAQVSRKKVSEVSKELVLFFFKAHDMLVSGPIDNHNPFQEKKSCAVL
uniref:Guanine nucleotide-binding protein subunit gamma n=1 Tax=Elaeophora elaphi TaxID=1147741 RepID=A0A0R3RNF7_9BILA